MEFNLANIPDSKSLSRYFPISESELLIHTDEKYKDSIISIINISKYGNKTRKVVYYEDESYNLILKTLIKYFYQIYNPEECVFGYVKGKGIVKNAKCHLHKKHILKIDIKNFFYSITEKGILDLFSRYEANSTIASVLSKITTYKGILFPGLNTSPILSNMYCELLDFELLDLANRKKCTYSRYADDITISGNDELPLINEIELILKKYNFYINQDKYKIMYLGHYQVVTGLSVFDRYRPRIPRDRKKRIRLACYLLSKAKDIPEYNQNVKWCKYQYLYGLLKYYRSIEPRFVEKMMKLTKGKMVILRSGF